MSDEPRSGDAPPKMCADCPLSHMLPVEGETGVMFCPKCGHRSSDSRISTFIRARGAKL